MGTIWNIKSRWILATDIPKLLPKRQCPTLRKTKQHNIREPMTLYQITVGNIIAYAKTHNSAIKFQNEIYKRVKQIADIKPIKKSKIPIEDLELINELNNKVQIAMRYH